MSLARWLSAACFGVLLASSRQAAAGDEAAAEALFVEARAAMRDGEYAKACPMLEESYRLVPGTGTKFNLGDCYEKIGKTASAWGAFRDVAAASKLAGQKDREAAAQERADALRDRLCRLTLSVPTQTDLVVKRDGEIVGRGQWGISLPIDPGAHSVEASAPGKEPWSTTLATNECPSAKEIAIPALRAAAVPVALLRPSPLEEAPTPSKSSGARTAVMWSTLGLGVAAVGVGSYFGVRAWSLRDQSNDGHCVVNDCDDTGRGLRNDSLSAGSAATVAFAVGGVLLAVGTVLWLTDHDSKTPSTP